MPGPEVQATFCFPEFLLCPLLHFRLSGFGADISVLEMEEGNLWNYGIPLVQDLQGMDNPFFLFLDLMVSIGIFALFRWAKNQRL